MFTSLKKLIFGAPTVAKVASEFDAIVAKLENVVNHNHSVRDFVSQKAAEIEAEYQKVKAELTADFDQAEAEIARAVKFAENIRNLIGGTAAVTPAAPAAPTPKPANANTEPTQAA